MDNIFLHNIFKCIFLNENFWVPNKISLKYVPWGGIVNKLSLVQIMGFHRTGDKPLFWTKDGTVQWCIYVSLHLNELNYIYTEMMFHSIYFVSDIHIALPMQTAYLLVDAAKGI